MIYRSIVVESLQTMFADGDVSVVYIYCDHKDRQTTLSLLSSLTKQQALQHKELPQELRKLYGNGQHSLSLGECTSLISSFSTHFRKAFILIDALDEHFINDDEDDVFYLKLLDELLTLQSPNQNGTGYRLFITSRENPTIGEKLRDSVRIEIHAVDADVEAYTRARILNERRFRFTSVLQSRPELGERIVTTLVRKAEGM